MSRLKTLTMNLMHDAANANSTLKHITPHYIEILRKQGMINDEIINHIQKLVEGRVKANQDALDYFYTALKEEKLI